MNDDLRLIVSDQTQQMEKSVGNWATAELRGDTTFLERNLADDFVGVGPYGFLLTKDEWLERHASRKLRYESFRLDEVRVRLYGEAAVMIARQMTKGKYEDNDLSGSLRATLFFAQQERRWMLVGIHMSFIAGESRAGMAKKMPRSLRKLLLTVHVVVSAGWIGIEAGLLALGLTGLYTRDPEVLRATYVAAGIFGGIFVVPVSMGALVTGVLLSFGTPWGLVRHYWVLVKFVLTVALGASGILVLNRSLQEAAVRVSEVPLSTLTSADGGTLRFQIIAL
jgi:hypothetical protein